MAVADDAGRGELYVSVFEDGEEIVAPHLAAAVDEPRVIRVAELLQSRNVAERCARRARAIEERGLSERYRDVTPIYVRLAEAEVKLRQKQNA